MTEHQKKALLEELVSEMKKFLTGWSQSDIKKLSWFARNQKSWTNEKLEIESRM